jgi:ABC-type glutathione transport system ATPase component
MNPSYTVYHQIARPMKRFGAVPSNQIRDEVIRLLEAVRLGLITSTASPAAQRR